MKSAQFGFAQVCFCKSLVVLASILFYSSVKAINPPSALLGISPMTFLSFSNLTIAESYQMQHRYAWYWTNLPLSFIATNMVYTQMVAGTVQNGDYRLALILVPTQAFAVAQVFDGTVVSATITDGGSGYITAPTVLIVHGGGTNATAFASISSGGVVNGIIITSGGTGYTNTPIIQIAQPPAVAISPWTQLVMRLNVNSGAIGWRLQFAKAMGDGWQNYGLISNTQTDLFATNDYGFYRLMLP